MTSCAIMQPTYLPWAGYFHLIASVDKFVLLDDVQFEQSSWQSRNKILLNGKEHLISIPTKRMSLNDALLHRIEIYESQRFKIKHWKLFEHAYRKAKHGDEALQLLQSIYSTEGQEKLVHFNGRLIKVISSALSIKTPIAYASEMKCTGRRSEHVAEICKYVQCHTYLSPQGATSYLEKDSFSEKYDIKLQFQKFRPKPYKQYKSNIFISHLSILDVIANIGLHGAQQYIEEQI